MHLLEHDLVTQAAKLFPSEHDQDVRRESISSTRFFKLRFGQRWRGAVWVDPDTGQAWLCAAGLRYGGEGKDFYRRFMADLARHGEERFLPDADDLSRLRLEQAQSELLGWRRELCLAAQQGVVRAAASPEQPVVVELPGLDGDPGGTLTLKVGPWLESATHEDSLAELVLQVTPTRRDDRDLVRVMCVTVAASICWHEQAWDCYPHSPGADVPLHTLLTRAHIDMLERCLRLDVPHLNVADDPGAVAPPTHAHYTAAEPLADAIVTGKAVESLCRRFFVPRHDYRHLPVCQMCSQAYERLAG